MTQRNQVSVMLLNTGSETYGTPRWLLALLSGGTLLMLYRSLYALGAISWCPAPWQEANYDFKNKVVLIAIFCAGVCVIWVLCMEKVVLTTNWILRRRAYGVTLIPWDHVRAVVFPQRGLGFFVHTTSGRFELPGFVVCRGRSIDRGLPLYVKRNGLDVAIEHTTSWWVARRWKV